MMIKTSDGEKSVSSAGVGGTALGIGIGALSLALLRGNCNGNGNILGGLFGCGCNNTAEDFYANRDSRIISALESALANEKAERYADNIGIEVYKEAVGLSNRNDERIQANYKELAQAVAALDKQAAVNAVNADWQYRVTNERIDCAFSRLKCYVDGTFVPGVLKMPADSVCPLPMSRYNSWTAPAAGAPTSVDANINNSRTTVVKQ